MIVELEEGLKAFLSRHAGMYVIDIALTENSSLIVICQKGMYIFAFGEQPLVIKLVVKFSTSPSGS